MYWVGGPTNRYKLLGVVGWHHVVGVMLGLWHGGSHTPGDERLSVNQVLEIWGARPGIKVAVTATLAVVGAAVYNRLQVSALLLLDLLPALDGQTNVVLTDTLLLVVLVRLRTEALEDRQGALVSYPIAHLVGIHPEEERVW